MTLFAEATGQKQLSDHAKLCKKAMAWLRGSMQCQFAVSEILYAQEIPDALGWRYDTSILVECKTSRADFLRDKAKKSRADGAKGLGDYRLYLCPPGVITEADLPPKWGLLYIERNSIKRIVCPEGSVRHNEKWLAFKHDADKAEEMGMLAAVARRLRDDCQFIRARL